MSLVSPLPLPVLVVPDQLLDFSQPVYTINAPSSLKSFNANQIQTYSNSYVNATLNLNSTDFICDPQILHSQPVTISIAATSSLGNNVLLDGCWALRSNALYKSVDVAEVKFGSTSNAVNIGDTISALEHYGNFSTEKYMNSFGLSYLDQTQSYNDLIGSSRNPLALYSSGLDMIEQRGSYPVTIVSNSPTGAVISTTLRQLVPLSPLLDKIRRDGSPVQGLSHLDSIQFNVTFYGNAGNRMLSLADVRPGGDVLTVTNITVTIGQPLFSFVQIKSRNEPIPRVLSYPLVSQERYVFNVGTALSQGQTTQFNVSSFNLSRVPHSCILYARPSNSSLLNNSSGVHISDTFAKLDNLNLMYDGQALFNQSIPENLYQISSCNGLQDTWTQFSGLPVIKTASNFPATYIYPVGSVIKLEFGKDISLYPGTCVGSYRNTAISLQVNITNLSSYTQQLEFYMILLYSDVLQLYDNNLANISRIPVSEADIINAKSDQYVHRSLVKSADISGSGLFSSLGNIIRGVSSALKHPLGQVARSVIKSGLKSTGHPNLANTLSSVGFGKRKGRKGCGGAMSGGGFDDYDGGAMASVAELGDSLYD